MHGTLHKYRSGCHCDECRAENARYHRARRVIDWDLTRVEHGTRSSYVNYGCRESRCKQANRDYMRAYRN